MQVLEAISPCEIWPVPPAAGGGRRPGAVTRFEDDCHRELMPWPSKRISMLTAFVPVKDCSSKRFKSIKNNRQQLRINTSRPTLVLQCLDYNRTRPVALVIIIILQAVIN